MKTLDLREYDVTLEGLRSQAKELRQVLAQAEHFIDAERTD